MKANTAGIRLVILAALTVAFLGVRFLAPMIVRAQNPQAPATQDEKPFDQAQALENLRKAIAGQENKPAEEVFKNIQMLFR